MLNLIVYNRLAGKGRSEKAAVRIFKQLLKLGQESKLFSNDYEPQFEKYLKENNFDEENTRIIVVGGDGTLSTIVNAVKHIGKNFPIAIYPAGTANDFSSYAKLPKNKKRFVQFILENEPRFVDIMKSENHYAIHAMGAGNFTHSMENFDRKAKRVAGRFGYYIKCFKRAFKKTGENIEIRLNGEIYRENLLFFYVVNSKVVGGFGNFSPQTECADGQLELIGFRPTNFFTFVFLFLKMLCGKHLQDKNVLYLRGCNFRFETIKEPRVFGAVDVDGNLFEKFPSFIEIDRHSILFYTKEGGILRGAKEEGF